MENYSYSSYPDSQNSSPRSREIDCENSSWDEPLASANYKVKFMCSYGGKIKPRPHDNQLSYIGGDTKILSVDRNIKFSALISKLSTLCCDSEVCFKYQLPGEDLDALISVTNDEDLDHMMLEYDRLYRASAKPARMRLFLFMVNGLGASFDSGSPKSDWFVDALNSVPPVESPVGPLQSVVVGAGGNPDFFGLEKGVQPVMVAKMPEAVVAAAPPPALVPAMSVVPVDNVVRAEERVVIGGEQVLSQSEIQRQINDLQRMQISGQEQVLYQQKTDGGYAASGGDYYSQKVPENVNVVVPTPQGVSMQMPVYWQDQNQMGAGGYQVASDGTGAEQQMYIIPTAGGMYQTSASYRPVTGQVTQAQAQAQAQVQPQAQVQAQQALAYYGTQRMVPDMYREQQVYSAVPAPVAPTIQQPTIGVYAEGMGGRQPDQGVYTVAYDGAGRQVYYATAGRAVAPNYQVVSASAAPVADVRQVAVLNQEGKVAIAKPN